MAELHSPFRTRLCIAALVVIGIAPAYLNGWYNPLLAKTTSHFWTVELVTWIAMPLIILFIGLRSQLFTAAQLGYHRSVFGKKSDVGMLLTTIIVTMIFLKIDPPLWQAAVAEFPNSQPLDGFQYRLMLPPRGPDTGFYRLLATVFFGLSAGLVEELYYRGMLRQIFSRNIGGDILFLIISTPLFAWAHWEGGDAKVAYTLVWGLAFGLIYVTTRNLWTATIAHIAIDLAWFSS